MLKLTKPKLGRLLWLIPCAIAVVWFIYPDLILARIYSTALSLDDADWERRGQVGDAFGVFNALFSGLGLAGLAINIYLQGVQLKKLEEKEQQNEDMLRAQVATMKATALLPYLNEEIDKLIQRLRERQSEHDQTAREEQSLNKEIMNKQSLITRLQVTEAATKHLQQRLSSLSSLDTDVETIQSDIIMLDEFRQEKSNKLSDLIHEIEFLELSLKQFKDMRREQLTILNAPT